MPDSPPSFSGRLSFTIFGVPVCLDVTAILTSYGLTAHVNWDHGPGPPTAPVDPVPDPDPQPPDPKPPDLNPPKPPDPVTPDPHPPDHEHPGTDPPTPTPPVDNPRAALEAAAEAEAATWLAAQEHSHPHGDSPVKLTEHQAALALVDVREATHRAIQSGWWSDPDTWAGRKVPEDGARVWIMPGRNVFLTTETAQLYTVRVTGTLLIDEDRNTTLLVDTMVIDPEGTFRIGTANVPISPDVTARVVFIDTGPHDPTTDPFYLGRGMISHGKVEIHGAEVTPFVPLVMHPQKGNVRLMLATQPVGWKAGDRIAITTMHEDEPPQVRTIREIVRTSLGLFVELDEPLTNTYSTAPDNTDCPSYVANLTRNVVFESENPADVSRRGHVMFMHNPAVAVRNAAFVGLGRTDKSRPITDPALNDSGILVPGSDTNPRSRYPVHFHRTGPDITKAPAVVSGCVVDGSPGWGFVNHASHVNFKDCVAHRAFSAGFVGEVSNEIGVFMRCLALGSKGMGRGTDIASIQDYGREGIGFYSASAGIWFVDCIANGANVGLWLNQYAYVDDGVPVTFPATNVADPTELDPRFAGQADLDPNQVPYLFKGCTAFGCNVAINLAGNKGGTGSLITGALAWNVSNGLTDQYTYGIAVKDSTFLHYPDGPVWGYGIGLDWGDELLYENVTIRGFYSGIVTAAGGRSTVRGCVLDNVLNIVIRRFDQDPPYLHPARRVLIEDVEFGEGKLRVPGQPDLSADVYISCDALPEFGDDINLSGKLARFLSQDPTVVADYVRDRRIAGMFATDQWLFKRSETTWQLYSDDQRRDFVFHDTGIPGVDGKTGREVWEEFHLAIGDALMPEEPVALGYRIMGGRIRAVTPLRPTLRAIAETGPLGLDVWVRETDGSGKETIIAGPSADGLKPGWNVVPDLIDSRGNRRGVVVKDPRLENQ